ncbi:MAG: polysaccharide biosynthesis protein [Deltaproteobacteria bacterium]|nr:polysaccharide biosynthesis protein [Deltaproteobacteria bacterium]
MGPFQKKVLRRIGIFRNQSVMVAADALLVVLSFFMAYTLRFEFLFPPEELERFTRALPLVLGIKLGTFAFFRLYQGLWRYTGFLDLFKILKAVGLSSLLVALFLFMLNRLEGYPRSVLLLDGILTFLAIGGIRVLGRFYFFKVRENDDAPAWKNRNREAKRLLIIGAGDAAEKVLREMWENHEVQMIPVGMLDDEPCKQGKTIHGIPVLGTVGEIDRLATPFDEILIAIPSVQQNEMRRIVAACEKTGKRFRTLPDIGELIDGKVSINTIREVTLEDLLGRKEVRLDQREISGYLRGKKVLITGAGGSIGSELVRQVVRFQPSALALVEMSELNLFRIEMEIRQKVDYLVPEGFLVDIRNRQALDRVFKEFQPEVVFHAAAYKHVPLQELHPWEAVYNNILGTRNLIEASLDQGVKRFVQVSTDKAVRPTNIMGASKRVAEMLVECRNGHSATRFVAVRFGNVLGSSGSAIPIFQEQIARGGPVTITHPEMTRYFMSIPEAAQLILQAGSMGKGGDIFILEMGRPVRIVDLAKDLIRFHGLEPEKDIELQFTGLRPGEKLYEELITEGEGIEPTSHESIMVLQGNHCDALTINRRVDELLAIAATYDSTAIKRKMQEIVPEYQPQLNGHQKPGDLKKIFKRAPLLVGAPVERNEEELFRRSARPAVRCGCPPSPPRNYPLINCLFRISLPGTAGSACSSRPGSLNS